MTTALHGIELAASLTVRNVHASVTWYRDVFGFMVAREFARDGKVVGARAFRLRDPDGFRWTISSIRDETP